MAKMAYLVHLRNPSNFYEVSNIGDGNADSVTLETFKNLPIKMTILECDKDLAEIFTITSSAENDPFFFRKDYLEILQGRPTNWKLSGVRVGFKGVELYFTKAFFKKFSKKLFECDLILGDTYDIQVVHCAPRLGMFRISFELEHSGILSNDSFVVKCGEIQLYEGKTTITTCITEYTNGRKHRDIEVSYDTKMSSSCLGYPCLIREYQ